MNIWWKIGSILMLFAALSWGVHVYDKSISDKQRAVDVAEYNASLVAAQAQAAKDTAKLTKEKDNAIANATQKIKARDAAVAKLTVANSGLRDTITNLGNSLSTTTLTACRARAATLSTVFGQCTERLVEMGRAAQGQYVDSLMYQEAWPK
jgi:hypothetical protein